MLHHIVETNREGKATWLILVLVGHEQHRQIHSSNHSRCQLTIFLKVVWKPFWDTSKETKNHHL